MTTYAPYFPGSATVSRVRRAVRCVPNEQAVWNHKWFEEYILDFILQNYNNNQSIAYGCLLSEATTDIIACTGGEIYMNGDYITVATPSNVTVVVDGWTVLYINAAGALISTVGAPLNNTNVQGANAPDDAVLIGFAKRTSVNFKIYPIQNFLDLKTKQQQIKAPVFVGTTQQVADGLAPYTINDALGTSASDTVIILDGGGDAITADRTINCNVVMQSPKGSIDTAGFKLTLSGAKTKSNIIVTNAGNDKIEITGAGSYHVIMSDNDAAVKATVDCTVIHNGNMIFDLEELAMASEAEGAAGTSKKVMNTIVSKKSQTAARNEGVVVKNHATNGAYQLDVTARRMTLFEDTNDTVRHIQNLSKTVDITVNGVQGCPRIARTGTIVSTGTAVTGTSTLFTTEYIVGDVLFVTTGATIEGRRIVTITDDTNIVVESAYTVDIAGSQSIANGGEAPSTTYWLWVGVTSSDVQGVWLSTRGPADTDIHTPSGYDHKEWINNWRNDSSVNLEDNYKTDSLGRKLLKITPVETSGTLTLDDNTSFITIEAVGGGGGGGGSDNNVRVGTGGGAGMYAKVSSFISNIVGDLTITIGAVGTAGNSGTGSGGLGGTTSVIDSTPTTLLSVSGGIGGYRSGGNTILGGAGGSTLVTNNSTLIVSSNGGNGIHVPAGSQTLGGSEGGSSNYGCGGVSGINGPGGDALNYGSGGGGGAGDGTFAYTGGLGFKGFVIIHEYE